MIWTGMALVMLVTTALSSGRERPIWSPIETGMAQEMSVTTASISPTVINPTEMGIFLEISAMPVLTMRGSMIRTLIEMGSPMSVTAVPSMLILNRVIRMEMV